MKTANKQRKQSESTVRFGNLEAIEAAAWTVIVGFLQKMGLWRGKKIKQDGGR